MPPYKSALWKTGPCLPLLFLRPSRGQRALCALHLHEGHYADRDAAGQYTMFCGYCGQTWLERPFARSPFLQLAPTCLLVLIFLLAFLTTVHAR